MRAQPPSPDEFGFELEEDSSGFTEEEAEHAHVANSPDEMAAYLTAARCSCGADWMPIGYALRRRKPHMYSKVAGKCFNAHGTDLVIRMTWMKP